MADDNLLQQDEIDVLIKAAQGDHQHQTEDTQTGNPVFKPELSAISDEVMDETAGEQEPPGEPAAPDLPGINPGESLTSKEIDALGEIGNISMGSAATTLSELLNKRVIITSPTVSITNQRDFLTRFNMPYLVIKVKFKEGFDGYNVLIIKMKDAIVMANLMMGDEGIDLPEEISEMEISAAAEAMNQMIGTASTSLADLLSTSIYIMPPETMLVKEVTKVDIDLPFTDPIVVISFNMNIENLLDTNIMQVIDLHTAREQSRLLWKSFGDFNDREETGSEDNMFIEETPEFMVDLPETPGENAYTEPTTPQTENTPHQSYRRPAAESHSPVPQVDQHKLNLLLDIPLTVSVILGRTKKQIKDVLQMTPGAIVELETVVGEPVEILVNGKLVASGEVVVVNENFGVKITNIVSTRDRIDTLSAG